MFIIQCPILWYAKVWALPSAHSSLNMRKHYKNMSIHHRSDCYCVLLRSTYYLMGRANALHIIFSMPDIKIIYNIYVYFIKRIRVKDATFSRLSSWFLTEYVLFKERSVLKVIKTSIGLEKQCQPFFPWHKYGVFKYASGHWSIYQRPWTIAQVCFAYSGWLDFRRYIWVELSHVRPHTSACW